MFQNPHKVYSANNLLGFMHNNFLFFFYLNKNLNAINKIITPEQVDGCQNYINRHYSGFSRFNNINLNASGIMNCTTEL